MLSDQAIPRRCEVHGLLSAFASLEWPSECEMAKAGLFYTSDVAALWAGQWGGGQGRILVYNCFHLSSALIENEIDLSECVLTTGRNDVKRFNYMGSKTK